MNPGRGILPLILAAVLGLAAPLRAQQRVEQPETPPFARAWQELVRRFDAYSEREAIVGGSVLLVRDGAIAARHQRGWQDRAARKPVDEHTIFHYGSITKTLTAVAILQLRDRGLLSLDDRVTRWIPELRRIHDPYQRIDSITIRMLLSHSAGFQAPTWPYRSHAWQPFEPTEWSQLVAMMPYQQLHFEPGSRYGYSNPAFLYLARIIELISGDPWQTYVQKNLFMPLGLERSYFGMTPPHLAAHRSHNYDLVTDAAGSDSIIDNGADFDPGITIPNGGWNAPLQDLARYIAFLAGGGDSGEILARATLEDMWQPAVPVNDTESMGLSFFRTERAGRGPILGHTGSQAGFRAFLFLDPARRSGVIAVFNSARDPSRAAAEHDALLEALKAVLEP